MLAELRHGSFHACRNGFWQWWRGAGQPDFVLVTDPPYTGTDASTTMRNALPHMSARDAQVKGKRKEISYGRLKPTTRREIARIAAASRFAVIWDRPEGMGHWRDAIVRQKGVWVGVATVQQKLAAPRIRADGPGCRHLCLALARRKGKIRWQGRPWAEYSETRARDAHKRPIPGTRSIVVLEQILDDLIATMGTGIVVVDPCAGTGVTLQAARTRGLAAIGWERDKETHAWALDVISGRGATSADQTQLFPLQLPVAGAT